MRDNNLQTIALIISTVTLTLNIALLIIKIVIL